VLQLFCIYSLCYMQYYFACFILFAVKNKHLFTTNNEIHKYKTRNYLNFHLPTVNLTKFYKGPYISGTKAFNHLPRHTKVLVYDMKCFKLSLKRFYVIILFIQLKNTMNILMTKTCKLTVILILFILLLYAIF